MMRRKSALCSRMDAVDSKIELGRRMLAKHRIDASLLNLYLEMTAIVIDVDRILRMARHDTTPASDGRRLFRKRPYRRLDACHER